MDANYFFSAVEKHYDSIRDGHPTSEALESVQRLGVDCRRFPRDYSVEQRRLVSALQTQVSFLQAQKRVAALLSEETNRLGVLDDYFLK